ncbi:FAD binding domain-containing protein [Xylogone sp. PMI_703]|nr:FAD binding domain-containing protein [Xylogone sp. PMI_703]
MATSVSILNVEHGGSGSNYTTPQQSRNGESGSTNSKTIIPGEVETEFLVVGAGPAGAALACFLASYGIQCLINVGLKGIIISSAPGTANTPRAHITNMAALECLRDVGLDKELEKLSSKGEQHMIHTRWCHSMAGEEFARIYSWGNDPKRKGDYESASPCTPVDLPQTLLEPVLVRYAALNGFKVRFNTTLLSFVEIHENGLITALVRDNISGLEYKIHTKYLFGADGARSQVVKQLDLPLSIKPSQGLAINVLVKADLSHLVKHRKGNLHWVMQPDCEHPDFGWMGIVRMVRPWNEWMFILFPDRDYDFQSQPSQEEYEKRVRDFIGDDTPAEILDISKWFINEVVADEYSRGNIFCLGDAVHRHPPLNGLGSNTCIQDAFNLAWKVAYVHRGIASPLILSSYSAERQPVGRSIITRANQAFRDHYNVWDALGMLPKDLSLREELLQRLVSPTPEGQKQRWALQEAITHTSHEFHGLGIEMGQRYTGQGIFTADEPYPYVRPGRSLEDEVLYYEPSTYPGCRLPHVWLNESIPAEPVSTIDLAGHGVFTLFTGIGGEHWKLACDRVGVGLGIPIKVYSIGFRQDWEDVYFDWARLRAVEESGAVLVRPDRFVAWRAFEVLADADACEAKLTQVMRIILGHEAT